MTKYTSILVFCLLAVVPTANAAERIPKFDVSDRQLSRWVDKLYELDDNRANPNQDEHETEQEKLEITDFLNEILATKVWRELYTTLHDYRHPYAKNANEWRKWIAQLWFVRYSRARGRMDTSGFEHTFIGEVKANSVVGLHNWVRFYELEKDAQAHFDYKGFLVKRYNVMAAVKFGWGNEWKRSSSFLIGTSPEFDMALYTLCFLTRRGRNTCDIEIRGCPLSVTSHDLLQQGKVFIGSIYPSAGRMTSECRRQNK